jgi:cellulose synthase/poly-beta-1,6-N-acetylglucosamine synthase-like glycosyltransferase
LSYARNQAIDLTHTDILLCIDADAVAEEDRAYELVAAFDLDPKIALVGGEIRPKFHAKPPFLIKANVIYDMYSLLDRGTHVAPFEKVV